MFRRFVILASATFLVSGTNVEAADPAVICESGKLKVAGKYASCVLSADSKAVKTGLPVDYTKCDATLGVKWEIAEGKGAGLCPGGDDDQNDISSFLDACTGSVAAALAGDVPLPADVQTCNTALTTCGGNLSTCSSDYATCSGDLGTCNASYSSCTGNLSTCNTTLGTCNTNLTTCSGDLGTCNSNYTTCAGDLGTCNTDLTSCEGDLAACEALPFAQVLKTGQTTCYNAAGSVIACAGTGQDGELQPGVARSFTDNGDGTITDNRTGLMWEKWSDNGDIHDKNNQYSWTNAFGKITTLNSGSFAGHNDWRLPTAAELSSLADLGATNNAEPTVFQTPCSPGCAATTCSCSYPSGHWSSTSMHGAASNAWAWNAIEGRIATLPKTNTQNVRAVRTAASTEVPPAQLLKTGQTTCYDAGGSVIACAGSGQDGELQKGAQRGFTDNGDGTITDQATGLTWEKLSDDGSIHDKDNTYTWANAFAKVATLNSTVFAGHSDWRVPNLRELESLVDASTFNPATYSAFSPGCAVFCTVLSCSCTASSLYWSSTTLAAVPSEAWSVGFNVGNVSFNVKSSALYARAVRGGS